MNFIDILSLALRNLRQSKLRTALTVIGVIVGVAAIVTMVSFGIGLQNNILKDVFARIDFFSSITVYGPGTDALLSMRENGDREADTQDAEGRRVLDDKAIEELRRIDGVRYVNPNLSFDSYVRFQNRTRRMMISGAPSDIEYNPRFKSFLAGGYFTSPNERQAVVSERLSSLFQAPAAARRGRRGPPPSGGPFRPLQEKTEEERKRAAQEIIGSKLTILTLPGSDEAGSPSTVFGIPLIDLPEPDADDDQSIPPGLERHDYRIVGVLKDQDGVNLIPSGGSIYIPIEQARVFREANRAPMERLGRALVGDTGYQSAEVRVADLAKIESVTAEIKKRGFRYFNIGNQIEEVKRLFLIVNAALALIGGIALLVASFGISNTMIMSIRERTREIGVMKAIGGSDGEIMKIFFIEASLIGLFGGVIGVLCGWGIDRIANLLANRWITQQAGQAIRHVDFFLIPWYLSGGAILFAVVVSLVAAIYPALSAARVDPIKALRYE